jgi:YYY domain-containing protein
VKAHEPSIRGLEKFMDYGFMQSILNARYFPAPDMWWAGGYINYYYFGHLVTALLTKISGLSLAYTFNLMLATLFALTATMSFSIGYQLTQRKKVFSGILTAFLVTLAGNMQTIYAFTKGYTGEDVKPFWTLFGKIDLNGYWYANATRFIPFTIHEFPSYSFVVSDVHGHVLSIPFVLLAIALLLMIFGTPHPSGNTPNATYQRIFYGFLLGVLLMTNALDGPIYGLLFTTLIVAHCQFQISNTKSWHRLWPIVYTALLAIATSVPFLFYFQSFATGIGVNCPPSFLANTKIGPFLFEGVEKCQHSPLWMMWLLWGFFWYAGVWLFIRKIWKKEQQNNPIHWVLKVFFLFSLALIIFPEFFYVKDIYPAHFRSNTMFKLGYQAFIMWSVIAGYVITHMLFSRQSREKNTFTFSTFNKIFSFRFRYIMSDFTVRKLFIILLIPQLFLVSIYPLFSVRSYFGELKTYRGIWGLAWIETEFPDNWKAIEWLWKQPKNSVLVEASGDSYTDYNHISAFTGLPTVSGWAVHEWLWRGTYDIVAPRQEDVRKIYELADGSETQDVLEKYHVWYIVVSKLEREKYKNIKEDKFSEIGSVAFQSGQTVIYKIPSY